MKKVLIITTLVVISMFTILTVSTKNHITTFDDGTIEIVNSNILHSSKTLIKLDGSIINIDCWVCRLD